MKWFKPKFSVCQECGVHFEPVVGYEAKWGHLCSPHRKPVMDRDARKERVMAWASANWERLEDMCNQENETNQAAYAAAQQSALSQMGKQRQADAYNFGLQGLGRPLGLWDK